MQLKIHELYKDTLDEINVEERGQLTIDRFNRWANRAVRDFVDYLTGRLHEEPTPKLGMLKTQKIGDLMAPLMRRQMIPFKDGLVPYPDDYDFLLDLRLSGATSWKPGDCAELPRHTLNEILNGRAGFTQIRVLSHDEVPSLTNSHIPALRAKPVAEQYEDGFLTYNGPAVGSAFVVYLQAPRECRLSMVMDPATHALVYDAAASVDPPFSKKVGAFLARHIAQYFLHWVREQEAIASSDAVAKTE